MGLEGTVRTYSVSFRSAKRAEPVEGIICSWGAGIAMPDGDPGGCLDAVDAWLSAMGLGRVP